MLASIEIDCTLDKNVKDKENKKRGNLSFFFSDEKGRKKMKKREGERKHFDNHLLFVLLKYILSSF